MPVLNSYVSDKTYKILEDAAIILHQKKLIKQPSIYAISRLILEDYAKKLTDPTNGISIKSDENG